MIKRLILLYIFSPLLSLAQSDYHMIWSEIEKDQAQIHLISAKNGIFVQGEKSELFKSKKQFFLTRFDNNLNFTESVLLGDLKPENYFNLETVDTPDGLAHLYTHIGRRNRKINLSVQYYKHDNLSKGQNSKLIAFDIRNKPTLHLYDGSISVGEPPFSVIQSDDRSKVCVFIKQEKVGKRKVTNYQYAVFDALEGFKLLHQGDFDSDDISKKYSLIDNHLSNKGVFMVLLKKYNRKRTKSTKNKKPDFIHQLYYFASPNNSFSYDVNIKKYFVEDINILSDSYGNALLAGTLRLKSKNKVIGHYLLKIDSTGNELFENIDRFSIDDIDVISTMSKDYISRKYQTIDLLSNDTFVYIVSQYIDVVQNDNYRYEGRFYRQNYLNLNREYFDLRTVIIDAYNIMSGEKVFLTTIPINHVEWLGKFRQPYFTSNTFKILDNNLFMFYNERYDNFERMKNNKRLKDMEVSRTRSVSAIASVNNKGDVFINPLDSKDNMYLSPNGVLLDNYKLYFIKQSSDLSYYQVGKLVK